MEKVGKINKWAITGKNVKYSFCYNAIVMFLSISGKLSGSAITVVDAYNFGVPVALIINNSEATYLNLSFVNIISKIVVWCNTKTDVQ